ncbi:E3 ubiquitin-protein ligase BRE1-like 2 isoform X2 [Magnolia sinica]|uniref:E3 ubiquitin-protein ligase BRE1-like 2 isoform X2 n=2 Tax=Magnolia sinica TaxID=86752 RepID=UPI002658E866|nr:E3 ubiquitin-protein ligase BRE1-like 2 isoform X2 [Magnolia sinica]
MHQNFERATGCHDGFIRCRSFAWEMKIENLQKQKQELQIFLDMYGQNCFEKRDVIEIKESERRAQVQAKILKSALDEHSLELRVKAANEAEAACQQRLSVAEAEIVDLRAKLDASERLALYMYLLSTSMCIWRLLLHHFISRLYGICEIR